MMLQKYLQIQSPLFIDGALATEMESRGADLHDTLWSAKYLYTQPDLIAAVHTDYMTAGADVIITASYQATIQGFMARGWSHTEASVMIRRAATLAISARDAWWQVHESPRRLRPLVAGSIGPYGAYTADGGEYRGNYGLSIEELMDFHRERLQILVDAGVDLIAFETIPDLTEAIALCRLLEAHPHMTAWMSFSCRGHTTCAGQSMQEVAAALARYAQICALGCNCTSPVYVPDIIRDLRQHTQLPIIVYPNSGEEYDAQAGNWHGTVTCDDYVAAADAWYVAGASLIGGCCRTSPETIRALRAHHWHKKPLTE